MKNILNTASCTYLKLITAFDIYGKNDIASPEGYEFTGAFRIPLKGEFYCRTIDEKVSYRLTDHKEPRLIIRPVKKKQYLFKETGEVRPPNKDEWATTANNGTIWKSRGGGNEPYIILTKVEQED